MRKRSQKILLKIFLGLVTIFAVTTMVQYLMGMNGSSQGQEPRVVSEGYYGEDRKPLKGENDEMFNPFRKEQDKVPYKEMPVPQTVDRPVLEEDEFVVVEEPAKEKKPILKSETIKKEKLGSEYDNFFDDSPPKKNNAADVPVSAGKEDKVTSSDKGPTSKAANDKEPISKAANENTATEKTFKAESAVNETVAETEGSFEEKTKKEGVNLKAEASKEKGAKKAEEKPLVEKPLTEKPLTGGEKGQEELQHNFAPAKEETKPKVSSKEELLCGEDNEECASLLPKKDLHLIPKAVHVRVPIDKMAKATRDSIQKWHGNWEMQRWSEKENLDLVKNHFPWFLATYEALENNTQSLVMPFLYLHKYGGVFIDADAVHVLAKADLLLRGKRLVLAPLEGKEGGISLNWMASVPGHTFLNHALNAIVQQKAPLTPLQLEKVFQKYETLEDKEDISLAKNAVITPADELCASDSKVFDENKCIEKYSGKETVALILH